MDSEKELAEYFAELCGGSVGCGALSIGFDSGGIVKRYYSGKTIYSARFTLSACGEGQNSVLTALKNAADDICEADENGIISVSAKDISGSVTVGGVWKYSCKIDVRYIV